MGKSAIKKMGVIFQEADPLIEKVMIRKKYCFQKALSNFATIQSANTGNDITTENPIIILFWQRELDFELGLSSYQMDDGYRDGEFYL